MTLLPVEEIRVTVPDRQDWPTGEDDWRCCNPNCGQRGTEGHHVVRRTATSGPVDWVAVDGIVLQNVVRVCHTCHEDITQHRAWIRHLPGEGWVWYAALPRGLAASPGADRVQHPKSGREFVRIGPVRGV